MSERVEIGGAVLIRGDCREVLGEVGAVDAVCTDPPYGLGAKWTGGQHKWPLAHGGDNYKTIRQWDNEAADLSWISTPAIVWGGQYFGLPPSSGWLIWDKIVRNFTSGHCELAWTSLDQPIRAFSFSHGALATEGKVHPTQKPVALMEWCLGFLPDAKTILDPFAGSGSTGVACVKQGRRFIGIEREPEYFDIMCRRIEQAYRQADLFISQPVAAQPKQEALFA
jgi:DNA modification methylase